MRLIWWDTIMKTSWTPKYYILKLRRFPVDWQPQQSFVPISHCCWSQIHQLSNKSSGVRCCTESPALATKFLTQSDHCRCTRHCNRSCWSVRYIPKYIDQLGSYCLAVLLIESLKASKANLLFPTLGNSIREASVPLLISLDGLSAIHLHLFAVFWRVLISSIPLH